MSYTVAVGEKETKIFESLTDALVGLVIRNIGGDTAKIKVSEKQKGPIDIVSGNGIALYLEQPCHILAWGGTNPTVLQIEIVS